MASSDRITCFFLINKQIIIHAVDLSLGTQAQAIQTICEKFGYNPFNLLFVIDGLSITYKAEYLHTLYSFQAEEELLHGDNS
jgi:hypothetical protein